MNGGDVTAVTAIEENVFSSWNEQQVASELQRKFGVALVAVVSGGAVQAWCCGMQAGSDAELLKITVHPEMQRLGIGLALLQEFCLFFEKKKTEQIFLEVRSRNYSALQLYKKQGFLETGRRKNYYSDPVDDAVVCVCRLAKDIE